MASTAGVSVTSISARATPKPAIVLPKIQLLQGSSEDDAQKSNTAGLQPHECFAPGHTENAQRLMECQPSFRPTDGLITAAVKDLELHFQPGKSPEEPRIANIKDYTNAEAYGSPKVSTKSRQQIGKWLHISADRQKHPKTLTWPSLQYKLWVDVSNLPPSNLPRCSVNLDTTRNKNSTSKLPERVTSRQGERVMSAKWSTQLSDKVNLSNRLEEDGVLFVGVPETWRVETSHVGQQKYRHKSHDFASPGADTTEGIGYGSGATARSDINLPRLSSRLGTSNSLSRYIDNSSSLGPGLGVRSPVKSNKSETPIKSKREVATSTTESNTTPLTDSRTNALRLKGRVRNPDCPQVVKPRQHMEPRTYKHVQEQTVASPALPGNRKVKGKQAKSNKKLSFAIPSAQLEPEVRTGDNGEIKRVMMEVTRESRKGKTRDVVGAATLACGDVDVADVSRTPVNFGDSFHVTKYLSTK